MNAVLQLGDAERRQRRDHAFLGKSWPGAWRLAGQLLDVPVTVVMPRTAPAVKRAATEGYGARIVLCEPTFARARTTVAAEIERHGFTLVHPFNDWNVIAGQGTAALGVARPGGPARPRDLPGRRRRLARGDGGCGQGTVARGQVIAAEPANADDARRSLESGAIQHCDDPRTIADGLRTTSIGERNFAVISRHVERIVTRQRGRDHRRDAVHLGTDQDRDRAVERRRRCALLEKKVAGERIAGRRHLEWRQR